MKLLITINHPPIAWARPGGSMYRYDTQKTIKNQLGLIVRSQLANQSSLSGSIRLEAKFCMPVPKGLPISMRGGYHNKRPDIDNMLKFYLDLCQGCGCFRDDSQICEVEMLKRYSSDPTPLGARVVLVFEEIQS